MTNPKAEGATRGAGGSKKRFQEIGDSTARVVQEAAALLDEEVAAGIVAAKKVQQRFQAERRVDPADFKEALQRFQSDGHQIIDALNRQVVEMQSSRNAELRDRLIQRTHDLLDLMVGFVHVAADVANQLVEGASAKPDASGSRSPKTAEPKTRPPR